jgi:hypothetical protein
MARVTLASNSDPGTVMRIWPCKKSQTTLIALKPVAKTNASQAAGDPRQRPMAMKK